MSINFESSLVFSSGGIHCQCSSLEWGRAHTCMVLVNFITRRKAVPPPNFTTVESPVIFCVVYTLEGITLGGISAEILKTTSQAKKKKNHGFHGGV